MALPWTAGGNLNWKDSPLRFRRKGLFETLFERVGEQWDRTARDVVVRKRKGGPRISRNTGAGDIRNE